MQTSVDSAKIIEPPSRWMLLFLIFTALVCGALIMVLEVLGSRVIGPFFGVSLFVWTSLITVTLVALALGYAIGVGFMNLIGLEGGFLVWLVGIAVAIVIIFVTFKWNLQKYVIIAATSVGGALVIVGTFMFGLAGLQVAQLGRNPIQHAFNDSPWWALFALVLVILGIVVQIGTTRVYEIEAYDNRI